MRLLRLAFTPRFIVYTLSILFTAVLLLTILAYPPAFDIAAVPLAVFAGLTVLGTRDLIQTRHAVLRNYPISAHLRFLLEEMRPEMRQYFFEGEKDGMPFSRSKKYRSPDLRNRKLTCAFLASTRPATTPPV